jgi:hypothetical protein
MSPVINAHRVLLFAVPLLLALDSSHGRELGIENDPSTLEPTIEEYCQDNPCRGPTRIFLRTDGEDFLFEAPAFWPVVQDGAISILPGEEIYIEAEREGDVLTDLRQVNAVENPEKTFVVKFFQVDEDTGMMLSLRNPFEFTVKFHMQMMDFSGGLHETSSCPAPSGAGIFESWPHPIVQIYLLEPRVLPDQENIACEY